MKESAMEKIEKGKYTSMAISHFTCGVHPISDFAEKPHFNQSSPISYPSVVKMSHGETACSYAALILYDDGIPVTAEKISALLKSAKIEVESYWPPLFAKLAEKRNLGDLIASARGGGGGGAAAAAPAAAAGGAAAATAAPVEEKKEEPKEESDDDMGFSLFD
ncbi:hypothetical protein RIF29_24020 [Crotalaria pallida]|uniref:60S acidic ribosomal protein P1 n=1 Tax=Crotalaria pallida TaxID=3830 RepID=A0AAN9HW63_CROPI